MAQSLGVRICQGNGQYLGLPYLFGRSKQEVFSYLKARVWGKKKNSWVERETIISSGKEVLIKSVLQGNPTYATSIYKLPGGLCNDMCSIMRKFWWNTFEDGRGFSWVAWEKLCESKCDGGLGFRDLSLFNQTVLAKQGWRIILNPNLLVARVLQSWYFPKHDFMQASLSSQPSCMWRSFLRG